MPVTLPPWLSIDPIAPARIRLAANAQRNARLAQEQAAQLQYQRLEADREHQQAAIAAQERASIRHAEVLKQTKDEELAQQAGMLQMRKEAQAQRMEQFTQQLRLKEQAAEQAAGIAAKRMQGMQAVQQGLQKGEPIAKLVAANAPLIFAGNEKQLGRLLPSNRAVAPPDYIAHELKDESGNLTGVKVRAGSNGGVIPLPRQDMTPEGRLREEQLLLNSYATELETAKAADKPAILARQNAIVRDIEARRAARGAAAGAAGGAVIPPPAALPPTAAGAGAALPEGMVRVRDKNGAIGTLPRAKWDAASEEAKKGWEELSPGKVDETVSPEATDEQNTDEETPTPEEEDAF